MELREKLEIEGCTIVDKDWYPKDPEPSNVLVLQAPLTPAIADALKCRMMAYNLNDLPNQFEGGFGLSHELSEVELKLTDSNGSLLSFMPNAVKKFRIEHNPKGELMVKFRSHFTGYDDALSNWCRDINTKEFDVHLVSLQGNLFDAPSKVDGPEGGTRVNMSPEEDDEDDAERLISREQAADTAEEDQPGPTLLPAVLAGGTHQKGTRGRKPRNRDREAIADGTAPLEDEDKQPDFNTVN